MKIEIYMVGKRLLTDIVYKDGRKDSAIGEEVLNEKLKYIYEHDSKTLLQLISEGAVVIKRNVWDSYTLKDNKYFVKLDKVVTKTTAGKPKTTADKPKTTADKPKTTADKPKTDADKPKTDTVSSDGAVDVTSESRDIDSSEVKVSKTGKYRVKLTKITPYAAGLLAIGGIVYMLSGGISNVAKNNNLVTPEDRQVVVSTIEPNIETTYNMNYEELITGYEEPVDSFEVRMDDPGTTYQYTGVGSAVKYDDMETQIQTINDVCIGYQPCTLEELVVESDYNSIAVINNMRNRVLTGSCDANTYLNNIVNYIFEGGNIFDGTVIKTFDSLSPFAQYVVLVSSETILQRCPYYEHTTAANSYNFNILLNSYDYMIDAATRQLIGGKTI